MNYNRWKFVAVSVAVFKMASFHDLYADSDSAEYSEYSDSDSDEDHEVDSEPSVETSEEEQEAGINDDQQRRRLQ